MVRRAVYNQRGNSFTAADHQEHFPVAARAPAIQQAFEVEHRHEVSAQIHQAAKPFAGVRQFVTAWELDELHLQRHVVHESARSDSETITLYLGRTLRDPGQTVFLIRCHEVACQRYRRAE